MSGSSIHSDAAGAPAGAPPTEVRAVGDAAVAHASRADARELRHARAAPVRADDELAGEPHALAGLALAVRRAAAHASHHAAHASVLLDELLDGVSREQLDAGRARRRARGSSGPGARGGGSRRSSRASSGGTIQPAGTWMRIPERTAPASSIGSSSPRRSSVGTAEAWM